MTKVAGCRFAPRCPFAVVRCRQEDPPLMRMGEAHEAACWRAPLERLLDEPAAAEAAA